MQRGDLEAAAANYSYLRGLFGIPLGALIILVALVNWGVCPLWAFLAAVVAAGRHACPSPATTTRTTGAQPVNEATGPGCRRSRHRRGGSGRRVAAAAQPGGLVA